MQRTEPELTETESKIVAFMRRCLPGAPTYQQIANEMKWASTRAVGYHIERMERKGVIVRDAHGPRLAEQPKVRVVEVEREAWSVPLGGLVCAGGGVANLSEPDVDSRLSMHEMFPNSEGLFSLRVRGDSMIGAHIQSGDYVIIRHDPAPKTGEKVVANIEGELTLKVFRIARGNVWLWPCNEEHDPIQLCTKPGAKVLGVLVGVIRREGR